MSRIYQIRSDVIDIRRDKPTIDDSFLIDTNVWYWLTYVKCLNARHYQITYYPSYLAKSIESGGELYYAETSFAELSHLIERTEYNLYCTEREQMRFKDFRHNLAEERQHVIDELKLAWRIVEMCAQCAEITLNGELSSKWFVEMSKTKVDGYDLFILETMKSNNITKLVTDDGDFSTVQGIQVFTANRGVINAAEEQGKLLNRYL